MMKTIKPLLSALATSLLAGVGAPALADQDRVATALHHGYAALEYRTLEFDSQGGSGDDLDGDFTGFEAGLTLTPRLLGLNVYLQPRLAYAFGSDDEEYWQVGGSLGIAWLMNPDIVLTPHVDVDGYQIQLSGDAGERTYSHLGYGGGLRLDFAPTERFALTLDVTLERMARAEVERPIPREFGGGDITLGLDNDWHWRATVQGAYQLTPQLAIFGRYHYTGFEYGESNQNSLVREPGQDVSGHAAALGLQLTF